MKTMNGLAVSALALTWAVLLEIEGCAGMLTCKQSTGIGASDARGT